MTSLTLPQVTLCCVDTTPRLPWALKALQRCLGSIRFADALLLSDAASLGDRALPPGVRWVEIEPLRSIEAYSAFVLKALAPHITTSHVLLVQWDGFVLNASSWRNEFLEFDYLGAPWPNQPPALAVGNGGFSLRSTKLLQALQDPALSIGHPEDVCIGQTHCVALEARGIRFPSIELARQFSVETDSLASRPFGFHGQWHLFQALAPDDALALVETFDPQVVHASHFRALMDTLKRDARRDARLQPALAAFRSLVLRTIDSGSDAWLESPEALRLCATLAALGELDAAGQLLSRHRAQAGRSWAEPKLWMRLQKKRLATRLGLRR